MAFTEAFAQESIEQIDNYFKKESKEAIFQLKIGLATVKVMSPKQKEQAVRVLQCLRQHLKTTSSSGQFDSILRLLSIHTAPDNAQLKAMLQRAVVLGDAEAIRLLVGSYGLDINAAQDSEDNTLLHLAVKAGALNSVQCLINIAGAEVNARNRQGATALHLAALKDERINLNIIDFLISKTAIVDALDNRGYTPFHLAAAYNCVKVLEALWKYGANVNTKGIEGDTALYLAVSKGHVKVYRFLVQTCRILVNSIDNNGVSALRNAVVAGDEAAVQFLLENGADVTLQAQTGSIVLHSAAEKSSQKICELLIDHLPKVQQSDFANARDNEGWTPFLSAISENKLDIAHYLLKPQFKVDINSRKQDGETALFVAIENGLVDAVKFLLDHDANISLQNGDGETTLHRAAVKGNSDICKLLLNHRSKSEGKKIDIYDRNKKNDIPLHRAAMFGHISVIEYFIECGIDINIPGFENKTALHRAIAKNHFEATEFLLAKGADISATDAFGSTALRFAVMSKDFRIFELLLTYKSKSELKKAEIMDQSENNRFFLLGAEFGNTKLLEYLIKCGVDKYVRRDINHKSALHLAASNGHVETTTFLLANDADVTAQDRFLNTPLHFAAKEGHLNICKILVNHQMESGKKIQNLSYQNKSYFTPLHLAAINGKTEIIDYFVNLGGEIWNTLPNTHENILDLAAKNGHEDTVVYLLTKKASLKYFLNNGKALHSAVVGGHINICRLLVEHKPEGVDIFKAKAEDFLAIHEVGDPQKRLELAKYFVEESKMDVNDSEDHQGQTPLLFAAKIGDTNLISYYIACGADVTAREHEGGFTALHFSVNNQKIDDAELLLQAGARPNVRNYAENENENEDEDEDEDEMAEANEGLTALELAGLSRNQAMVKLLQNYSVNHEITIAIWNISHKIAFSALRDRNLAIIPPLQNIIVEYAKLDLDLDTLKSMGLNQKIVIEMAEEVLLSFASSLGKEEKTFLNNLAAEIFEVVPDPSKCKIYWEKLKEQFKKNPQDLDSVQRPSKLDKNKFASKSETKEREEKHGPAFRRSNELEKPSVSSELQSAQPLSLPDVKREKVEEKSQSSSNPKSNAFDLDADAIMLPPSTSTVTSSSRCSSTQALVATTKSCLDEWFWQLPAMKGSEPKSSKKKGEKRKLEEKQEADLESHKQSKNENSLDAPTLQTTSSFFSTPSSPNKRKSEGEHESENGKKAKCESLNNESGLG